MFKVVVVFRSNTVSARFDDYLSAICMFKMAKKISDFVSGHIYVDIGDEEEMII